MCLVEVIAAMPLNEYITGMSDNERTMSNTLRLCGYFVWRCITM
jgi:hypothetical protein